MSDTEGSPPSPRATKRYAARETQDAAEGTEPTALMPASPATVREGTEPTELVPSPAPPAPKGTQPTELIPPPGAPSTTIAASTIAASSATSSRLLTDRDAQHERQEHLATVGRLRRILPLAIVLWLGFIVVDVVMAMWIYPNSLVPYIVLRIAGVVPMVAVLLVLRRAEPPSPRRLAAYDVMLSANSAGLLSGMCLLSGGLTSPLSAMIALVIAGRAAVWPSPWRVAMVRLAVPALASPVVLAAAMLFSPLLQSQVSDPAARATYFFYWMLIVGAWGLMVIASHNAWALRRQVFATRSMGRYRLESRIGRGGMGEVWSAWHEQLKRKVAVKILHPEVGTEASAVARFEREVMATAALTHPNTIRIYEHGVTDDGLWYFAMEFLDGSDLYDFVMTHGPLSAPTVARYARQAAGAIAEAHRHGIVHRDIKPENLFVADLGGETGFIKVLDFGIAMTTDHRQTRLTGTGWVSGTPAYMAPEVAAGVDADPTADVYALGATLYFAATATAPFYADTAVRILQMHADDAVQPPSERLGTPLPPALEQVIMRCLHKNPSQRYPDGQALLAALRDAQYS